MNTETAPETKTEDGHHPAGMHYRVQIDPDTLFALQNRARAERIPLGDLLRRFLAGPTPKGDPE